METKPHHLSVGGGLTVVVQPDDGRGLPLALIHFRPADATEVVAEEGCVVQVTISPARLLRLLGSQALADQVMGRGGEAGIAVRSAAVRRIAGELRSPGYDGPGRDLFVQGKVLELLAEGLLNPAVDDSRRIAFAARDILLADPIAPPTMAEMAQMLEVPARRLNDVFRGTFGMTVFEWLADWRLMRARDQVMHGRVAIKDIAAGLGYSHVNNFTNAFTRRFGVPPARLRASAPP